MTVFTRTWDATYLSQPSDGEDINLGATRIRNLKEDLTQRLVVDHSWEGNANDGKHNAVTLRPAPGIRPVEADDGYLTNIVIGGISELHWVNDAGQVVRITNAGSVNPSFPGNASVSGTFTANAIVVTTDLTTGGDIHSGGATFLAESDPQFYASRDGLGNPLINFDTNTYIYFDRTNDRFVFVVNSVEVGSFP